jgi:hypothetical protein
MYHDRQEAILDTIIDHESRRQADYFEDDLYPEYDHREMQLVEELSFYKIIAFLSVWLIP